MDNKTLVTLLAKRLGRDTRDINMLIEGLASVIKEKCGELYSIAIPGFGTFTPIKEDEKIVPDLATGKRLLMPPAITLTFKTSALLRKRMTDKPS